MYIAPVVYNALCILYIVPFVFDAFCMLLWLYTKRYVFVRCSGCIRCAMYLYVAPVVYDALCMHIAPVVYDGLSIYVLRKENDFLIFAETRGFFPFFPWERLGKLGHFFGQDGTTQ